ncbi:MAG: class I tRNA ligase family protein, partial [Puniceicoccales bacterium]|nr:class I tRNA ligase family protein [Puniceicoccales bacterium]
RQRSWGIPLPVFYDESGDPFLDADYINFLAAKVEKQGTSVWFEEPEHRLLKGFPLPSRWRPETLRKGSDTLDVWMDSGCSHWAILKPKEEWPADLYLEGSDQHRGWCQSSLWTSVLMTGGRAPYRTVLTHGFFIDEENRQKISKSEGPPQTSEHYVERFGADVLRLWVASENYRDDIPVSQAILDHVVNTYRTLRNTLRFQLGNLFDFRYDLHALPLDQLMSLDQWALHETTQLIQKVETAYEAYEFHKVYQEVGRFCTIVLSARYHDILKDRLYTLAPSSPERRSAQTAIFLIFNTLVRLLAPILVFTTDEAYAYLKSDGDFVDDSIHLGDFPVVPKSWNFEKIHADIHALFHIREDVQEALEGARREGIIGQSLDAQVELTISEGTEKALLLKKFEPHLPEYFIVSQVHLTPESNPSKSLIVRVRHADGVRCPRTWRWVDELVEVKGIGPVSKRCAQFLTHTFP